MTLQTQQIDDTTSPILPPHPEGEPWQFVMLYGDRMQAVADTATELLPLVIAGYDRIEPDDVEGAFYARVDHAAGVAAMVQHGVIQTAIDDGFALDDDVATTAMMSVKTDLIRAAVRDLVTTWDYPIPLLLVATLYAPYTDQPAPAGDNVILVDPYTEKGYLASLDRIGLITFTELSLI